MIVALPTIPRSVAVITARPSATPVTVHPLGPGLDTVATAGSDDLKLHDPGTLLPLASNERASNWTVPETAIVGAAGVMTTLVTSVVVLEPLPAPLTAV